MASALALMAQGSEPLFLNEKDFKQNSFSVEDRSKVTISLQPETLKEYPQIPMRRYRIAVGHKDKIRPGNILGAIANEAEISSDYIGTIQILQDFTVIDLPDEMPNETFEILKKTRIFNKTLNLEELTNKNNISSPREKDTRFKRESIKRNKKRKPHHRRDKKFSQNKAKR
jgi:ATP-dependent RNA helicase DeaD